MPKETNTKSNGLRMKLFKITDEMGKIPKNGFNQHFKYKFVQEQDAMDALRVQCLKNKVLIIPSVIDSSRDGSLTTVNVKYTICDCETDEAIEANGVGQGADTQDKGAPKALTSAYKFFILKMFMVSTGDDIENHDIEANAKPKATPKKPTPNKAAPLELPKGNGWWCSDWKGKTYILTKNEGEKFTDKFLTDAGFKLNDKTGTWSHAYTDDLVETFQQFDDQPPPQADFEKDFEEVF